MKVIWEMSVKSLAAKLGKGLGAVTVALAALAGASTQAGTLMNFTCEHVGLFCKVAVPVKLEKNVATAAISFVPLKFDQSYTVTIDLTSKANSEKMGCMRSYICINERICGISGLAYNNSDTPIELTTRVTCSARVHAKKKIRIYVHSPNKHALAKSVEATVSFSRSSASSLNELPQSTICASFESLSKRPGKMPECDHNFYKNNKFGFSD